MARKQHAADNDGASAGGGGDAGAGKKDGQGGAPQDGGGTSKGGEAQNLIDALGGGKAAGDGKDAPGKAAANDEWFWSDGVKGADKAPEWFDRAKYKSVAEQARAYPEAAKKIGELSTQLKGFKGAPEQYDLAMPEALKDQIEWRTDDPLLAKFQTLAKENGMSQELFGGILGILAEYELSNVSPDWAKEKAAIGERADERLKDFTDWYGANMEDEDAERIKRALGVNPSPADIYLALEAVMQAGREPQAKPADDTKDAFTLADVDREWNAKNDKGERLVDIDPAYREKIRAKRAKVVGQGDHKVIVGKQ